jgi:hypothetical protein
MWTEPTEEQLKAMPGLYQTEHIPMREKLIQMHFFMGTCDWFVIEFDGEDLFFGFAILNQDYEMAEWGYISFSELKSLKTEWVEVDFDLHWKVRPANEVPDIRKAMRWDIADRQEKELFEEMKKMPPLGESEA